MQGAQDHLHLYQLEDPTMLGAEADDLFADFDHWLEEQATAPDEAHSLGIVTQDRDDYQHHHGFEDHHYYAQGEVQIEGAASQPTATADGHCEQERMDFDELARYLLEGVEEEKAVTKPQPPTKVYDEVEEVEEVVQEVEEVKEVFEDDVTANEKHHVLDPKREVLVSSYPVLAYKSGGRMTKEKKRMLAWVAFFTACRDHTFDLEHYRLQLLELDQPTSQPSLAHRRVACEMGVSSVDAWVAPGYHPDTGQRLWQIKLPFVVEAPADRKPRQLGMYEAVLVHRSTDMAVRLGGASVGSTSNQLRGFGPKVEAHFPGLAQRRLVRNFRERSIAKNSRRARHYRSGKGSASAQATHKPARFHEDELATAVTLPVHPMTTNCLSGKYFTCNKTFPKHVSVC